MDIEEDLDLDDGPTRTIEPRLAPWVEKYRPENVDEVSHQEDVVRALKRSIEIGSIPHLLFHGPPGTGKTTTILAVARALYGPDLYKSRILELNASDERGIKVVREKIKIFAQAAVGTQKTKGYPCPRFKLIILDEADTMTPEAQSALRRIIEVYSKVTRFCLLCNYVTRIIEPLASRCAKFRFQPLPQQAMKSRLQEIAGKEQALFEDEALEEILRASQGDMRKAVTFLQSCYQLNGRSSKAVSPTLVLDITGKIPDSLLDELWEAARGYAFDNIRVAVENLGYAGYPLSAVLAQLLSHITTRSDLPLSDADRALIALKIAEIDERLIQGAGEGLQLLDLASFISRRIHQNPIITDNL